MNSQFSVRAGIDERATAVVRSALWAAAGDALGWITELSRDEAAVQRRSGSSFVREPVEWTRRIGGRTGVSVLLPAGTYSDDTQLRLAVCRATRGDGTFDVEPFAKVELPVWTSYALGAGKGTRAAATNLGKRSANWFSNFFRTPEQSYVTSGGNGAAMRVQPHVWASRQGSDVYLLNVLRDALVTHGHAHGFVGAFFHALTLKHVLDERKLLGPNDLEGLLPRFAEIPTLISQDAYLSEFWQLAWEKESKSSLEDEIKKIFEQSLDDVRGLRRSVNWTGPEAYHQTLEGLGCFDPAFRGSGIKTAIAAAVLAWLHQTNPEQALIAAANELYSDTDTIATMAGALLGVVADHTPDWPIQDADYIGAEALRLARIAEGTSADGFAYPDLATWNPPTKQVDAVGKWEDGLALPGLGRVFAQGEEYRASDAVWQWMDLEFGQSVLVKRRPAISRVIKPAQMPGRRHVQSRNVAPVPQGNLPLDARDLKVGGSDKRNFPPAPPKPPSKPMDLDEATEAVIKSNFDEQLIGQLFLRLVDNSNSLDKAIAFSAIVAKARLARRRRAS